MFALTPANSARINLKRLRWAWIEPEPIGLPLTSVTPALAALRADAARRRPGHRSLLDPSLSTPHESSFLDLADAAARPRKGRQGVAWAVNVFA